MTAMQRCQYCGSAFKLPISLIQVREHVQKCRNIGRFINFDDERPAVGGDGGGGDGAESRKTTNGRGRPRLSLDKQPLKAIPRRMSLPAAKPLEESDQSTPAKRPRGRPRKNPVAPTSAAAAATNTVASIPKPKKTQIIYREDFTESESEEVVDDDVNDPEFQPHPVKSEIDKEEKTVVDAKMEPKESIDSEDDEESETGDDDDEEEEEEESDIATPSESDISEKIPIQLLNPRRSSRGGGGNIKGSTSHDGSEKSFLINQNISSPSYTDALSSYVSTYATLVQSATGRRNKISLKLTNSHNDAQEAAYDKWTNILNNCHKCTACNILVRDAKRSLEFPLTSWEPLNSEEARAYLPEETPSVHLSTPHCTFFMDPREIKEMTKMDSIISVLYTGGSILDHDWKPIAISNDEQLVDEDLILCISMTHHPSASVSLLASCRHHSRRENSLQLWRFFAKDNYKNGKCCSQLCHDLGPVFVTRWYPLPSHNSTFFHSIGDFIFSSTKEVVDLLLICPLFGFPRIISIPSQFTNTPQTTTTLSSSSEDAACYLLNDNASLSLVFSHFPSNQQCDYISWEAREMEIFGSVCCADWSWHAPHVIVGGTTEGYVVSWSLHGCARVIVNKNNSHRHLLALSYLQINPASTHVICVAVKPVDNARHVFVILSDGVLCLWDRVVNAILCSYSQPNSRCGPQLSVVCPRRFDGIIVMCVPHAATTSYLNLICHCITMDKARRCFHQMSDASSCLGWSDLADILCVGTDHGLLGVSTRHNNILPLKHSKDTPTALSSLFQLHLKSKKGTKLLSGMQDYCDVQRDYFVTVETRLRKCSVNHDSRTFPMNKITSTRFHPNPSLCNVLSAATVGGFLFLCRVKDD